jgi:hypothetical protein
VRDDSRPLAQPGQGRLLAQVFLHPHAGAQIVARPVARYRDRYWSC